MSIESSDTFGNYLIHGIDEIVVPDSISWWPSAPGWKVLGVIAALLLVFQMYRWMQRWWRDRYRREALRQLAQAQQQAGERLQDVVAKLPYFIKVTAIQAYPREEVASLSGKDWLDFLDNHYSDSSFSQGVGKHLIQVSYLPSDKWDLESKEFTELIHLSKNWIATHTQTSQGARNV